MPPPETLGVVGVLLVGIGALSKVCVVLYKRNIELTDRCSQLLATTAERYTKTDSAITEYRRDLQYGLQRVLEAIKDGKQ